MFIYIVIYIIACNRYLWGLVDEHVSPQNYPVIQIMVDILMMTVARAVMVMKGARVLAVAALLHPAFVNLPPSTVTYP